MPDGKIAVITGGNRGLGRAAALAVAEDGTDVVLTYRSHRAEATTVVEKIRATGRRAVAVELDMTDVAGFAAFAANLERELGETWGRDSFDFLVNNAGSLAPTMFGETDVDAFDAMVAVHFKGVFFFTQALEPLVADGGRILNTSSGLTRFAGEPVFSVYAACKGAIEVLTRYWAKQLGPRQIRVNTVAPGAVGTDFGGGVLRDDEAVRSYVAGEAALGRVGEPEDIGPLVAAMLAEGTQWVTGQRIEASGGMRP
jgi:NAD(P)-dependent dehydrogenase (short-subunit alcohol dehydrogenase family)